MGGKTSAYKVLAAALGDLNVSGLLEEFKVCVSTLFSTTPDCTLCVCVSGGLPDHQPQVNHNAAVVWQF